MTASVVIAAHNEEQVIGRALEHLLARAEPGEFDVVVVCNGCTDRTAEVAAAAGGDVRVVELAVASKVAALRGGDDVTEAFPRIYMDADVVLATDGAREIVDALARPGVLAAAPTLQLDFAGVSWPVRSYFRLWQELPGVVRALSGRGVYALSAEGRARFGQFPDVVADDYFVNRLFSYSERVIVASPSIVRPPRTVTATFRRKVRVFVGNAELDRSASIDATAEPAAHAAPDECPDDLAGAMASGPPRLAEIPPRSNGPGWLQVVRASPKRIVDLPIFLAMSVLTKAAAAVDLRRGRTGWARDATSRDS